MLDRDFVNNYLEITESYKMPARLMEILFNPSEREKMFDAFSAENPDKSMDWWTDYFQDEQGDRNALKQDFTPHSICKIVAEMTPPADSFADVCAGTGGLTIALHDRFPDAYFHCEEISERTIPVLLFNLAVRNVHAEVICGDSLEQTRKHVYKITPGDRYSDIAEVDDVPPQKFGEVVSNPPYSIKWSPDAHKMDERFNGYELAPKAKADYAFILHGMSLTADRATFILPHGVLFRGQREGKIRAKLCEEHRIRTVLGLPDNMFLNTGIPVCIMQIAPGNSELLIIDADDICVKEGKLNVMRPEHIEKVLDAVRARKNIDKLSQIVEWSEVERNEYNLNIPRYVDKFDPEPLPDIVEVTKELKLLNKEIEASEKEFYSMLDKLVGTTEEAQKKLDAVRTIIKDGQYEFKLP